MYISDLLATFWLQRFKVMPKATIAMSLGLTTSVATLVSVMSDIDEARRINLLRENSNNYQTQIIQLNETEKTVKNLLLFVQTQKDSLRETEEALQNLRSERDKIQPLLQVDKATLETIFKVQEDRASANVWRERGIGFVSGLFASLLASVVWAIGTALFKKRPPQKELLD